MKKLLWVIMMALLLCASTEAKKRTSKDVRKDRRTTEQQIAKTQKQLKDNEAKVRRQLNRLSELKAELEQRADTIMALSIKLDSVNTAVGALNDSIAILSNKTAALKANHAKSLRAMRSRRQGMNDIAFIFSAKSFSEAWRRKRYLEEMAAASKKTVKQLAEATAALDTSRQKLETLKKSHQAALNSLRATQRAMQKEQTAAEAIVVTLKKDSKTLTRELQRRQEQSRRLDQELNKIIDQELQEAQAAKRRQEEAAAKAAAEAKARAEAEAAKAAQNAQEQKARQEAEKNKKTAKESKKTSKKKAQKPAPSPTPAPAPKPAPKPAETPKPKPQTPAHVANFAAAKGHLPAPVEGRYSIVSQFGTNEHPELSKIKVDNLGIDLQAQPGAHALAVFDGIVSSIFRLDAFNNVIIVRHGEYLTVYAGLKTLAVKKGDTIKTLQPLGTIYSDPDDDHRTILHFEIRREKEKLNPKLWLK